jgi:uncharacterized protein
VSISIVGRPYSTLRSGRRIFWDQDFQDSSYTRQDVAYGLARGPRFSGQTLGHRSYSIAQHSVLVSELLRSHGPLVQLLALWHDCEEFMLGDMGTPIKRCLPEYKAFAAHFRQWMHHQEGLPEMSLYPQIKWADEMAMLLEGQSFMPGEYTWQRLFGFGRITEVWSVAKAAASWEAAVASALL